MSVQIDGSGSILGVSSPAFIAYQTVNQSVITGTFTKLAINFEEYDTDNCYSTSLYRFTPTIAGYYQISGALQFNTGASPLVAIFKNGTEHARGPFLQGTASQSSSVSALVYLNGSSDYAELYGYQQTGSTISTQSSIRSLLYFTGHFARPV